MATGADWRVGDAEREAVVEQLREHYATGRLTIDEFRARLDAVYSATTASRSASPTRQSAPVAMSTSVCPRCYARWLADAATLYLDWCPGKRPATQQAS